MIIPETPKTLLDELSRQGELDELKWRQFDDIYRPVVAFFIQQRFATLSAAADDIVQDTMARLVAVLREGKYRRDRSRFRTYLAALVHNCCNRTVPGHTGRKTGSRLLFLLYNLDK